MPKVAKELSAREVSRLTEPGTYPVGGVPGLLLSVSKTKTRSWILRTTIGTRINQKGKEVPRRRDVGLGPYPAVSVAEARVKAQLKRELVEQGVDPVEQRKAAKRALLASQSRQITFSDAADQCHKKKASKFRSDKYSKQWISVIRIYANPIIGHIPVDELDHEHILKVLEPIWYEKTETAKKLRGNIEAVIRWAYTKHKIDRSNPARWNDNLRELLGAPSKIYKVKHLESLSYKQMPEFMGALQKKEGMGARALEFAILTAARSGEVRNAAWGEIDLDEAVWTIPEEKMKAGRPHRVPLSDAAMAVLMAALMAAPIGAGGGLVFIAVRGGALSDMTLGAVLRRMKVDAVPNGFRSTFKDWAREKTRYQDEVSELALAHVNNDATRAAYARSELLDIRRDMMRDWASYCGRGTAKVVPIAKKFPRKGNKSGVVGDSAPATP